MTKAIYHLHHRKRIHVHMETFPHKNKYINMLDRFVLCLAFLGPMFDIPQLYKIYTEKSAQGVSMFTWGLFTFFAFPWLLYGIIHKEKPIIVSYSLWILIDSIIVIGILMYG